MDAKSKARLKKYLIRDKKKLADGSDQDETDIPNNVPELMKDINGVISLLVYIISNLFLIKPMQKIKIL